MFKNDNTIKTLPEESSYFHDLPICLIFAVKIFFDFTSVNCQRPRLGVYSCLTTSHLVPTACGYFSRSPTPSFNSGIKMLTKLLFLPIFSIQSNTLFIFLFLLIFLWFSSQEMPVTGSHWKINKRFLSYESFQCPTT